MLDYENENVMPAHKGMEDHMPRVKYDKKKVLQLLEQIIENVSSSDDDRHKVAMDLFLVALDAQDTEYRVQSIINYLAKEFGVPTKRVAEVTIEEIPF